MSTVLEVVAAPYTLYLAPVDTEFPTLDEVPHSSDGWIMVGTSGDLNYNDKGVTVTHDQKISEFIPAGGTAARKAWRTEEHLTIDLELVDLSPAQYALILNDAAVTQHAAGVGHVGYDEFPLLQGLTVANFALVARGLSPLLDGGISQYQVPIVYQAASPAPVGTKGTPAFLAVQFAALADDASGFGDRLDQSAEAS